MDHENISFGLTTKTNADAKQQVGGVAKPPRPNHTSIIDTDVLPQVEKQFLETASEKALTTLVGVGCDHLVEPVPTFNIAPCERIKQGENNTFIVLGRDRPAGEYTGYGGKGHMKCGTVDIVAVSDGGIELTPVLANPNFELDAARIYVSQKTDVDENFRLPSGEVGDSIGKSAVALKADGIRIIGREGVKIVTGVDSYNSRGAPIGTIPGIDLIAGGVRDQDPGLQPLVKGDNLVEALEQMLELGGSVGSILDAFITYQIKFNAVIMSHTHPEILTMALSQLATGSPVSPALSFGRTFASPELVAAGAENLTFATAVSKKDTITTKFNNIFFTNTYLRPWGKNYINSYYNNTN